MKHSIYFILVTVFLLSCDCFTRIQGTVSDSATGNPIIDVRVLKGNPKAEWAITDSSGNFEFMHIDGGFFCNRHPELTFVTIGYDSLSVSKNYSDVRLTHSK